jgi:hypothetical protein
MWTRGKIAGAVVLALGALAAGAGFLPRQPLREARKPAVGAEGKASGRRGAEKTPVAARPAEREMVEVKGRVLDPEGRPVRGAGLSFQAADQPETGKVRATTDKEGRFRFRLGALTLEREGKLIATAKGFAASWENLTPARALREVELKLAKETPLTGRLLGLEGSPLGNVTVQVTWVGRHPRDKTGEWIDHFVAMHKKGYWINEGGLQIIRPGPAGVPAKVTTDKDGWFRIPGVGKDRVLTLMLRSERTVAARLQVPAREGPKGGWVKGDHGLYPSGFTFLLSPCKPIVGVVKDKKTGKPIAGVLVAHSNCHAQAVTNEKGEYRIVGAPKEDRYMMALGGRKGVPYIDYTQFDIRDTPGLEPLKVDFALERGLEISGKVIDKATGKPVRGSVHYLHSRDNPHVKDFTTLTGAKFIVSKWGEIGPDGSFTVLGIPGPGALAVRARDSTRYVRINARPELERLKVGSFPIGATHAVAAINASEKDPRTLSQTIELTAGGSREGRLVDAEGKPVAGARVVGMTDDKAARKIAGESLTMTGLRPDRDRALVVLHQERKIGAVAAVRGGEKPFVVTLQSLGALAGRLVDADGKGLPGRKVRLILWLDPKKYENLPDEWCPFDSLIDGA